MQSAAVALHKNVMSLVSASARYVLVVVFVFVCVFSRMITSMSFDIKHIALCRGYLYLITLVYLWWQFACL